MTIEQRRRRLRRGTYRNLLILMVITGLLVFGAENATTDEETASFYGLAIIFWILFFFLETLRRIAFIFRGMSGEDQAKAGGLLVGALAVVFAIVKVLGAAQERKSGTQSTSTTTNTAYKAPVPAAAKPGTKACPTCRGAGHTFQARSKFCGSCGGAGYTERFQSSGDKLADMHGHGKTIRMSCTACGGSGQLQMRDKSTCSTCHGKGKVPA